MKKDYISPLVTEVYVETECLLDGSYVGVDKDPDNKVDAGGSLSSGRRGEWGDLWARP